METAFTSDNQATAAVAPEPGCAWHRRALARVGLQGKLVLCFMALLSAGLGASCYVFVSHSSRQLAEMVGENARQLSYSLALAARGALEAGESDELNVMGRDLLKSHNILFVAFLDAEGKAVSLASRDRKFRWSRVSSLSQKVEVLMEVGRKDSGVFSEHLEIVAPVLGGG